VIKLAQSLSSRQLKIPVSVRISLWADLEFTIGIQMRIAETITRVPLKAVTILALWLI
jgi:hypothetical protein